MHSRIFYYARIRGVTIPYTPYRAWLRTQLSAQQPPPRIWEWDLLQAMCNHRDRIAGGPPADEATQAAAAAEKDAWLARLLDDGGDAAKPAWMAAAPRVELYVDRDANGGDGGEQVPYPERFAAIIKAVQTGQPVEGIVEVPDIVARNPVSLSAPAGLVLSSRPQGPMLTSGQTTAPFGKLKRPRKPWEKDQHATDGVADAERAVGWDGNPLDESFPDPDEDRAAAS